MADQWYYRHDDNRFGPFSGRQLRALAVSGTILRTDTVWKEGVEQGVLASSVRHLFTPAAGPVAEPTPTPPVEEQPREEELPAEALTADEPTAAALPPVEPTPESRPTPPKPPQARKRTAVAVLGATIVSQDGTRVRFKKRCTTCHKEDSSTATLTLRPGSMREWFFCPNCRKRRVVELRTREQ